MINRTEQEEREYLEIIKEKLLLALNQIDKRVRQFSEELRQNKEYIYEHQSGMDEADMVAAGQSINRMAFSGESAVASKKKLMKLFDSPYFGRIDFVTNPNGERIPVYIGIHTFSDLSTGTNLIYDWRAPISSMFYDFELGNAWYETPSGKVEGEIVLKRQYRIRDSKMEFMIENAVSIHDEVLQRELSKTADEKMKNIVATIQRDQNAIIRNDTAAVMIIQGVAGSGKTSIALHRIAFLLYRHRDTMASKDILIISPNKVFADYISNVLPELGEEHIPETGMEELASELLENKYRFQTFFKQVSFLLEKHDEAAIERIQFKSSYDFLTRLNQYLIYLENNFFEANEIRIGKMVVKHEFVLQRFKAYHRIPLLKRLPEVVKDIQREVRNTLDRKLTGNEKSQIWKAITPMLRTTNLIDLYKNFYAWAGKPNLFNLLPGGVLEYSDVFPLIYCKIRLEGFQSYDHVKHLLIDEMQDYAPVQYAVLSRVFNCKKTILGDTSQKINPYIASSAEEIHRVFPQADKVKLVRSYRSTLEIIDFTQRILPNPELVAIERHGPAPAVKSAGNAVEELAEIKRLVTEFRNSGYQSMGIICKTPQQAESLYRQLKSHEVHLLTAESASFKSGVTVTTAHLAKGLEFDEVIVPFASAYHYRTETDRRMLYIACTRAMHKLTLTHTQERTPFV